MTNQNVCGKKEPVLEPGIPHLCQIYYLSTHLPHISNQAQFICALQAVLALLPDFPF